MMNTTTTSMTMFSEKSDGCGLSSGLKKVLLLLTATVITGCSSAHKINSAPETSIQATNSFSLVPEIVNQSTGFSQAWWKNFNREELNGLIEKSLSKNYDIAQAVAVLEQTRAVTRQTVTQRLPLIDIAGGGDKLIEGNSFQGDSLSVSAGLSWELDVWNRIGDAIKAERLTAQARAFDIDALRLSISAEISNAYFGAIAAQQQISLLKQQLKLDQELERILQLRLDNGVGDNVDLLQQQAQLADSQTLIPLFEATLIVFENRLDVLLGEFPDGKNRVSQSENLSFSQALPAIQVPAALLLNRPDLLAAQADLVAADADISVAIKDRLPRFNLTGIYGYEDSSSTVGPIASLAAGFVQPLIDWGQRKAEVERNKALYREQLAAYTQLYLEAVEDVENALVQEAKQREFLTRLDTQRQILAKAVNSAEQRFKQGIDDYQPVIDALQDLRDVERSLVDEKLALINFRIELFRAIGGPTYDPQIATTTISQANIKY